jgi:ABC-type transport system involved in cytochrome bd biosynthesis fused ATPase/permease subunit
VPIADFSRTRQKILAEKDSYEFLDKMCIEDRHKAFLGNASGKKGLADYLNRIADTDKQIQDLADLIILERTSDANEEIKKLLETLQNYTREQDRSNDIISWLSLLLAISSVFSVAEYITGVFLIESLLGKVITLAAIICVFAVVAVIIIKTRR